MIQVPLTQGKIAIIDDIDADLLDYKWCAAKYRDRFYVTRYHNILMHRIILSRILKREIHHYEYCDHINCDGLDNRRVNLRICTNQQNLQNQRLQKNNKSGYKGVAWHKRAGKWRAQIAINGKRIHLGLFGDPKEAYEAYCKAAIQYFGDFARLE